MKCEHFGITSQKTIIAQVNKGDVGGVQDIVEESCDTRV